MAPSLQATILPSAKLEGLSPSSLGYHLTLLQSPKLPFYPPRQPDIYSSPPTDLLVHLCLLLTPEDTELGGRGASSPHLGHLPFYAFIRVERVLRRADDNIISTTTQVRIDPAVAHSTTTTFTARPIPLRSRRSMDGGLNKI